MLKKLLPMLALSLLATVAFSWFINSLCQPKAAPAANVTEASILPASAPKKAKSTTVRFANYTPAKRPSASDCPDGSCPVPARK